MLPSCTVLSVTSCKLYNWVAVNLFPIPSNSVYLSFEVITVLWLMLRCSIVFSVLLRILQDWLYIHPFRNMSCSLSSRISWHSFGVICCHFHSTASPCSILILLFDPNYSYVPTSQMILYCFEYTRCSQFVRQNVASLRFVEESSEPAGSLWRFWGGNVLFPPTVLVILGSYFRYMNNMVWISGYQLAHFYKF